MNQPWYPIHPRKPYIFRTQFCKARNGKVATFPAASAPRLSDTILIQWVIFTGVSKYSPAHSVSGTRCSRGIRLLSCRVRIDLTPRSGSLFFRRVEHISGHCIPCLMVNDDEWETHKTDRCQSLFMNFPKDAYFVAFKNAFKFAVGFCYGCGLDMVCVLPL